MQNDHKEMQKCHKVVQREFSFAVIFVVLALWVTCSCVGGE